MLFLTAFLGPVINVICQGGVDHEFWFKIESLAPENMPVLLHMYLLLISISAN